MRGSCFGVECSNSFQIGDKLSKHAAEAEPPRDHFKSIIHDLEHRAVSDSQRSPSSSEGG
jgi:hypothetical protein